MPHPHLWGGARGRKLNQPMANDFLMKMQDRSLQTRKEAVPGASWLLNAWWSKDSGAPEGAWKPGPFPQSSPYELFTWLWIGIPYHILDGKGK